MGEVLTPKVMLSVGSSTESRGSGRGSAGSVMVSPMVISGSPATATMSPGPASSISTSSMPRAVVSDVTVPAERDDAAGLDAAVRRLGLLPQHRDALAHAQAAVADAADGHAAHVVVGGEVGDEQLQRVAGHVARRRRVRHEQVHERLQVLAGRVGVETGRAGAGVGVDDGELDLAVGRAEIHEELVDVVHDDSRAARRQRSILLMATMTGRCWAMALERT